MMPGVGRALSVATERTNRFFAPSIGGAIASSIPRAGDGLGAVPGTSVGAAITGAGVCDRPITIGVAKRGGRAGSFPGNGKAEREERVGQYVYKPEWTGYQKKNT